MPVWFVMDSRIYIPFPYICFSLSHSLCLSRCYFYSFHENWQQCASVCWVVVNIFKLKTHVFISGNFLVFTSASFTAWYISTIFCISALECCWSDIGSSRCSLSLCALLFFPLLTSISSTFFSLDEFLNLYSSHSVKLSLFQELFVTLLFFFLHTILFLFTDTMPP